MSYSAQIRIKTDYLLLGKPSPVRKDGTAALYLQVLIDGSAKKIPLDISWHPDLFDEAACKCLHSPAAALALHREESQAEANTLICQQMKSDAYQVFTDLHLRRQPITMESFLKNFRSGFSKDCLVKYYTAKLEARRASHEITEESWKSQRSSLRKLMAFSARQPFSTMAERGFAKKYDTYLQRLGHAATTRWGFHKDVKTYLNLARKEDNIWFPDPYVNFVNSQPEKGNWEALLKRDLQLLDAYYHVLEPGTSRRQVLRRWLFALASCGMRISDQQRIQEDWRMFDVLSFIPFKNRKKGKKIMVKLSRRSQELWDDAVREKDSPSPYVFTRMSGQKANAHLHAIEQELELSQPIHNHIARHTFATQYLDEGGRVDVLQKMMGHSNVGVTMKYVRTTPQAHEQAAQLVDNMFGPRSGPPDEEQPRRVRPAKW
ncbi:tyrosine-type recombinase/integrase [Hymenobacter sp. BT18]|uniref:tyrosine-type recombinase/integrase n=1 Tax=Hymenobacter sp. BT18 TaxID=2835648 RepID=UPI00143E6C7B|nr:tyrosine-type recombinase/integrase [Hymenobacter sp. BT18]QIX60850.1 tyrosine-type recombinase/integrase [Hymenobacter sp. BT18]